ncbi:MAG: two-component system regulatory protein YycI [Xylanivirga thermophila]|jgi:regulatory protein YycI of two-component signal transduction system YycFG|uniref:two-component system regulatory protein YycI n=1 Tax=Xylanivirga thermophila TaxID=2496273 RepID=UPI00101BE05D|nr:two-component system regulatory protein YycI [Xylanivirga thermophila]
MKKILITVICLGMVLSVSGCKNASQKEEDASGYLKGVDLAEYIKSIELPKNLSITFDPSKVVERASAKVYNATWLRFDPEKTAEHLLRYDIISTGIYATGPYFEAGNEEWAEYLNMYDDVVKGGFSYSLINNQHDLINRLQCVISSSPEFPDNVDQLFHYSCKTDYDLNKDLSFLKYEEAVNETEKVFTECGFPALSVQTVYSMDVETMKNHYQLYLDARESENSGDKFEWSKEDECYLIHFRQDCDGIPLINTIWVEGVREGWEPTETRIHVFYSKDGIISIHATGLYKIGEEIEEGSIISAPAALKILLDDYKNTILTSETKILSMELNYVGIYRNEQIELVPTWVFSVSYPVEREDKDETVYECTYFVINAFTGERIRTAVDDR